MLIKHVSNVDVDDEFIKVKKDDLVIDVIKRMKQKKKYINGHQDVIHHPILAAYVIEGEKPIGVIYKDDIINKIILKDRDPQILIAGDIMKPPICCNLNQEVRDVVNLIIDRGLLTVAICDGEKLISVISVYDAIFLKEEINGM